MTEIRAGVVDVFVIHIQPDGEWRVLLLQRSRNTRCPGAWEAIHGRVEEGERPEQAAVREVAEESGLTIARLYSVTVNPFFLHSVGRVELALVFAAFVDAKDVVLGEEHQEFQWLSVEEATSRFFWPRSRHALADIVALLSGGNAGPAEDVLRVSL